jgi:hypothetical protein
LTPLHLPAGTIACRPQSGAVGGADPNLHGDWTPLHRGASEGRKNVRSHDRRSGHEAFEYALLNRQPTVAE